MSCTRPRPPHPVWWSTCVRMSRVTAQRLMTVTRTRSHAPWGRRSSRLDAPTTHPEWSSETEERWVGASCQPEVFDQERFWDRGFLRSCLQTSGRPVDDNNRKWSTWWCIHVLWKKTHCVNFLREEKIIFSVCEFESNINVNVKSHQFKSWNTNLCFCQWEMTKSESITLDNALLFFPTWHECTISQVTPVWAVLVKSLVQSGELLKSVDVRRYDTTVTV